MPMLLDISMICLGESAAAPCGSETLYLPHTEPVAMGVLMSPTMPSSSATIIDMGFITEPGS